MDHNTLIVTSSDADSTAFGCEAGTNLTWFSQALFVQAVRRTRSFWDAFNQASDAVREREKSEGYKPSNPQIHIGAAMKQKLEALERRLESADPGRPAIHAALRAVRF